MIVNRLLAARHDGPSLAAHTHHHGPLPAHRPELLGDIEQSGLLGRGGAGFPLARKISAVAAGRGPAVVVANGCEGEPASGKDTELMTCAPHLVLDGLQSAAAAVRADQAHVVVHDGSPALPALQTALRERCDPVRVRITTTPARYVASEETALVSRLNGGPALPTFTPPRPFERGVGGRPTLISNVETLAHLGLIARHGATWFRQVGTVDEPGTRLLTVNVGRLDGTPPAKVVIEVASGTTIDQTLVLAGARIDQCSAVLVGGYFGTWLAADVADGLPLTHAGLRGVGGALGAGVLLPLGHDECGLVQTAALARYLADQNARQCGPCFNGLPLIADAVTALAHAAGARSTSRRCSAG